MKVLTHAIVAIIWHIYVYQVNTLYTLNLMQCYVLIIYYK